MISETWKRIPPPTRGPVPSSSSIQRMRGMILLLVMALLVLLALMGTIFILTAGADRKTVYAENSATSMSFAQEGVLNTIRGIMLNGTLDQAYTTQSYTTGAGHVIPAGSPLGSQVLTAGVYNTADNSPAAGLASGFNPDSYDPTTREGGQIARFWDYPESGAGYSPVPYKPTTADEFYQSVFVGSQPTPMQYAESEPWLVSNLPYELKSNYSPGEEIFVSPAGAAPTRWIYGASSSASGTPFPGAVGSPWTAVSTQAVNAPLLSELSPYLYDPATGQYDFTYSYAGGAGSITVPNTAVVEPRWQYTPGGSPPLTATGTLDANWNLLPYSDPNGTRYRFAIRVMDMSALLNVNSGWIANPFTTPAANTTESTDPYAAYGTFITSCPIFNLGGLNIDSGDFAAAQAGGNPLELGIRGAGTPGRIGNYSDHVSFYTLPNWQQAMDEYEIQYPSPTVSGENLSLFGVNSEMDMLTAGGAGAGAFDAPFYCRLAALLPGTLGLTGTQYGAGYRGIYTTCSWSRSIAPVSVAGSGSQGSPTYIPDLGPARINLNTTISTTVPAKAAATAGALANELYETLITCGFTSIHAASFVVNYFAYRYGNGDVVTAGMGTIDAEPPAIQYVSAANAPDGIGGEYLEVPALGINASSQALVSAMGTSLAPGFTGVADTNSYYGITAQPFLNEMEVQLQPPGSPGNMNPTAQIQHWSVELMNPFATATPLSLQGWILLINGSVANGEITSGLTINLGTLAQPGRPPDGLIGSFNNAAGNGGPFAVVLSDVGDPMLTSGIQTPYVIGSSGQVPISGTIQLLRPVPNPLTPAAISYAVVDVMQYDFSQLRFPPDAGPQWYADIQRDNIKQPRWGCDNTEFAFAMQSGPGPSPRSTTAALSELSSVPFNDLGLPNNTPISGNPGIQLFDRQDGGQSSVAPGAAIDSNSDLFNFDDLNCIAREANYQVNGGPNAGPQCLSQQLALVAKPATPTNNYATSSPTYYNNGLYYVDTAAAAPYKYPILTSSAGPGESFQAALYLDFAYDPRVAATFANADFLNPVLAPAIANGTGAAGDVAPTILSMITLTARNQTASAAAGALPNGIHDLVRMAGKVNINTAGQAVLFSAFSDDAGLSNINIVAPVGVESQRIADISQLVADTIAFRDRAPAGTVIPTLTFGTADNPMIDTSDFKSPGYPMPAGTTYTAGGGFRSLGDLLLAFMPSENLAALTTLQQRDAVWADVANFITVRSDTFAVYGYLQALRLNTAYTSGGGIYAPTDWYNATQGTAIGAVATRDSVSSDPINPNAEFILEGARRFEAIIDRSYCNRGTTVQPHIVALKLLPQ